jgi:hypothetical protein
VERDVCSRMGRVHRTGGGVPRLARVIHNWTLDCRMVKDSAHTCFREQAETSPRSVELRRFCPEANDRREGRKLRKRRHYEDKGRRSLGRFRVKKGEGECRCATRAPFLLLAPTSPAFDGSFAGKGTRWSVIPCAVGIITWPLADLSRSRGSAKYGEKMRNKRTVLARQFDGYVAM